VRDLDLHAVKDIGGPETAQTGPWGTRPAPPFRDAFGAGGSAAYVQVQSSGAVNELGVGQTFVGLDNVTFRAGL
jgi:hypothetical protein